jgi:spermidine synthase
MVDIDKELVDMVKEHMPEWHQGAFDDPRTTLVHTDARKWLEERKGANFDVIISDLPNPHEDGPAQFLFTREYFKICSDALAEDGVFAMQAGSASENYPACMASCIKTLEAMPEFKHVAGYYGIVSTFFQPWGFVLASKSADPLALSAEEITKRFAARGVKNRYYTPRFHQAVFTLPEWINESKNTEGRILTDAEPFIWEA